MLFSHWAPGWPCWRLQLNAFAVLFYSGTGEKRRLLIACNIMYLPPIIVLDEPVGGLDHLSCLKILDSFKIICEKYNILLIMTIHCPTREMWDKFDKVFISILYFKT